jgi:DNA-binding CsgD family transcriptional regulator
MEEIIDRLCLFDIENAEDELPYCIYLAEEGKIIEGKSCMRVSFERDKGSICLTCFKKSNLLWKLEVICFDADFQNPSKVTMPVSDLGFQNVSKIIEDNIFIKKNYEKFSSLTEREKEIISFLSEGFSNSETAEKLNISEDTVKQHRKNIKKKINLNSLPELIRFAQAFELNRSK